MQLCFAIAVTSLTVNAGGLDAIDGRAIVDRGGT